MQGLGLTQYVPGESLLHDLDPRSKVLAILLLSVAVFVADGMLKLVSLSFLCLLLMNASRISAAYYWQSLRPFLIIIIPTALLQVILISGPVLYHIGPLAISQNGLLTAGVFILRLTILILILRLLTLTTTPTAIINGCERMLSPLQKVGFPVLELLTIMNLAFAFIPFFLEEGQRVWMAQTSRGLSLREGSVKRRLESLLALLVPLWRGAFERSHQLAEAMEARGYRSGSRRTCLRVLHWDTADSLAVLIGLAVLLLVMIH
ncbi:MAG: energy-coupling factor transporter transmembrane component T family protein [Deltaproteobacteria bacterium]